MRSLGVIQAQFALDGTLTMCVLGPKPVPEQEVKQAQTEDELEQESYEDILCASA